MKDQQKQPENQESRVRPRSYMIMDMNLEAESGDSQKVLSRDISMNGVFVETESTWPIGTRTQIKIHLQCGQDEIVIDAKGRVVREEKNPLKNRENPGMGIAFTEIDSDSSMHLYQLLKYQKVEDHAFGGEST